METYVLIPPELRLKVRPNLQSPSIAKLLEPCVSIVSTVDLPKGLKLHPAQGTVRCGKLELYSTFEEREVCDFYLLMALSFGEHVISFKPRMYFAKLARTKMYHE